MDRFDPTQCACANDMSNRLIAICKIIWRHAKRDSSVGTTVSDGQRIFEPSRSFDPVTRNIPVPAEFSEWADSTCVVRRRTVSGQTESSELRQYSVRTHGARAHDMSIRPTRVEVINVFRSDRSRKLRCRNGLFGTDRLLDLLISY